MTNQWFSTDTNICAYFFFFKLAEKKKNLSWRKGGKKKLASNIVWNKVLEPKCQIGHWIWRFQQSRPVFFKETGFSKGLTMSFTLCVSFLMKDKLKIDFLHAGKSVLSVNAGEMSLILFLLSFSLCYLKEGQRWNIHIQKSQWGFSTHRAET